MSSIEMACFERSTLERLSGAINRRQAALHDDLLRRMLCLWVSELDPCMVYDRQGNLLGLTADGDYGNGRVPIVIRVGQVIEPVY